MGSNTPQIDRERIDALLKRSDVSWRAYDARRAVEWRVNFSLWAGLGIFAGFMFQLEVAPSFLIASIISSLLVAMLGVYTFLWKIEIQRRNSDDLETARAVLAKVDSALGLSEVARATTSRKFLGLRATHLSQVMITSLFVVLTIMSVWTPRGG